MAVKRTPFQGVSNIIRFNWPFYAVAAVILFALFSAGYLFEPIRLAAFLVGAAAAVTIMISLAVSFYVYDISGLYELRWIRGLEHKKVLNVNAGFDETSSIIRDRFPTCDLTVCDFYDTEKHTEASIKRARNAFPLDENAVSIPTEDLPFANSSFDNVLVILSAHEIRDTAERVVFFRELRRILKPDGTIFVTEHVRGISNFLAYTIGAFHFHSEAEWLRTFDAAGLVVAEKIMTTPFITTFVLRKNIDGNSL